MNKSKLSSSKNLKSSNQQGQNNLSLKQDSIMKSKYSSLNGGYSQISYQYGTKIAKLQERGNFYANKIEQECQKLLEVETEIEKAQQGLDEKRKELMSKKRANGNDHNPKAQEHKVKSMYHHLDLLNKSKDQQLSENEVLKEAIDKIRKDKNIFNKILEDQKAQLQVKKEKLKQVLIQSKIAKQEIQNGEQKLIQFKQDAIMDRAHFEQQLGSIFKVYDNEGKQATLQQRFNLDYKDLIDDQIHYQPNQPQQNNFITQPESLNQNELPPMSPEQKKEFQKELEKESQQQQQHQLQQLQHEVQVYENTFQQLKKETGKDNINDIVKTLAFYEEDNYSLFRYINGLREEYDSLEKQLKQLKSEIKDQKVIPTKIRDDKQMKKYIQLRQNIEETKKKKELHEKNQKEKLNQVEELKISLPVMFDKIKCKSSQYVSEFQKDFNLDDIDESNMVQYIAIIERRTNDLLQLYNEVQKNKTQNQGIKKNIPVQKEEDLQNALIKMDEEIEEINEKLKDAQKYPDVIIKEKDKLSNNQLSETAQGEILKLIQNAEKPQKGKKNKR